MESGDWLELDTSLRRQVDERLAEELGLAPGQAFLDYPEKSAMFDLNLLVVRRGGRVLRLGPQGHAGMIGLPRIAGELYRSARVLRLFTHGARRTVTAEALVSLARLPAAQVRDRLDSGARLLAG